MNHKRKRYDCNAKEYKENTSVDKFFADILRVINKHKLTISHEDNEGGFIVVPANKNKVEWLLSASVDMRDNAKVAYTPPKESTPKPKGMIKYKFYKPDDANRETR